MTEAINDINKQPITVLCITLNEAHNLNDFFDNVCNWAQRVVVLDSFSADKTVDICLKRNVEVYQRKFTGFGDQWNFIVEHFSDETPWIIKLDPDERLTDQLKLQIEKNISKNEFDAFELRRRLFFMGSELPIEQNILRIWKSGYCRFSDVLVNEYPIVDGKCKLLDGTLRHVDSPNLDHWLSKQNRYTTAEAITKKQGLPLSEAPLFWGTPLQRRMWLKKYFYKVPGRYLIMYLYLVMSYRLWRCGKVGFIWAFCRVLVLRLVDYKHFEMGIKPYTHTNTYSIGYPDRRVKQFN